MVLSGPSGAGKSTLLKKLFKDYENVFGFSVSREYPGMGSGVPAQSLPLFIPQIMVFRGLSVSQSVCGLFHV